MLTSPGGLPKEVRTTAERRPLWAGNYPHGPSDPSSLSLGLPFAGIRYSGRAAILKARRSGGTFMHRRVNGPFRTSLIDPPHHPGHEGRDGRRRTFTGQCCQPLCRGDTTRHLSGPTAVTEVRQSENPSGASAVFGAWLSAPGRNVIPPPPFSPGPSATPRCRAALASYLSASSTFRLHWPSRVRVRISGQARTRPGRIRFHPVSPF